MSHSENIREDLLGQVFNHLVLPPEIPDSQDNDLNVVSSNVLVRLIRATKVAIDIAPGVPWERAFRDVKESLNICTQLNKDRLERKSLLQHFESLVPGQMLILYLNEQNAGLLIHHGEGDNKDWIIFESFEASASSSHVIAAGHAMQWDFPGRSARIRLESFADEAFRESLASFLDQASMESLYSLQASARKAGVSVGEIRDTTDPALITQMLMPLLEAVGTHYQAPVLRKRIRDDVNLGNSRIPWRRLPFWLILRVATQRQLCTTLGAEDGQIAYKFLVAILLAELLDDAAHYLSPHKVVYLRTKLARRMVKLEANEKRTQLHKDAVYNAWFTATSRVVEHSIQNANRKMGASWDLFKKMNNRRIFHLPYRAPPASLELSLRSSGNYLDSILSTKLLQTSTLGPVTLPNPLDQSIKQSQQFTDDAFHLAALEENVEVDASRSSNLYHSHAARCLELEGQIEAALDQMKKAFKTTGPTYDSSPEQNSAMMLAIFTLWVELDKSAIAECQLLSDHAPVFHPELLDCLQLPTRLAMERLQNIQEYLVDRHVKSIYGSILETHVQDSIALRYTADSTELQYLGGRIQDEYVNARQQKRGEHIVLCDMYDEHTEGIAANPCLCVFEDGEWKVSGCTSCWHGRQRYRLKIQVLEAFLPKADPARSTIIFELGIPDWLSAYRSATWQIMNRSAHPYRPKSVKPAIHLKESGPLQRHMRAKSKRLSMASQIKCFEQTHYNFSQGKVPLTKVLLPFATDFRLYDSISNVWVADLEKSLTLEHLCGIQIPRSLQDVFPKRVHPPTTVDGPSSYEIQANQTSAPKNVSLQAFSASQKILAGKRRRWPNLLVELSSSNLNLSDEEVMRVICQLATQAGPGMSNEPLRAIHEVFKYPVFTRRLETILQKLLESVQTNWREHNIMQLVITLALRLQCLAEQSLGNEILIDARKHLMGWISELRMKMQNTKDGFEAQRYATYGLYAALLCRRTFAVLVGSRNPLSRTDLSTWIQVSIAVQENMLHDLSRLPDALRDLLFRDAKMVYHLQNTIKGAMKTYRSVVGVEILNGSSGGKIMHTENDSAQWTFLPEPHGRWVVATTPGYYMERLHFNYIEGHLLVNGKPRSKLPLSIANDETVRSIFGVQHLITYPSNRPGMSHRLVHSQQGLQIHFGLRDKRAVIRAIRYNKSSHSEDIWEFVPESRLGSFGRFDLPIELIKNCGHWLNLKTCCLEIRRGSLTATTWSQRRLRDWLIDVPRRRAYRGEGGSQLVDPHSETFAQIADIFADFEQADRLTVFQPQNAASSLTVELKHFDLQFEVNRNHLLYCQQLNAEIDTNQDAGTWYGLRSKIVMREVNTQSRSIIVPLGKLVAHRNGFHVDVRVQEAAHYARFTIDDIVGRLSCGPEPRLIYMKALCHGITSFCLPDTLTGRTGSSEALSILRSGIAQPWRPITKALSEVLEELSKLAPQREYYPPTAKRFQRVSWDPNLTSSIQCDGYLQLVQSIKLKSNHLEVFSPDYKFDLKEISHLSYRGKTQREIYDPLLDAETAQDFHDAIYTPRDRISGTEAAQVYKIACVILSDCSQFGMEKSLRSILESFDIIGGFSTPDIQTATSHLAPLINQIEDPVIEKWGDLINFCRQKADRARLLFRLGLLAFNINADMDIIHSLAAFCLVEKLRNLVPPQYQHFADFKSQEKPSVSLLESLISSKYPKFEPDISKTGRPLWYDTEGRNATQLEDASKKEGMRLAKDIHKCWPIPAIDMTNRILSATMNGSQKGQTYVLLDVSSAMDVVKPEWERRYANLELSKYVLQVDDVLSSLCRVRDILTPSLWVTREPNFKEAQKDISHRSIVQSWAARRGPVLELVKSGLVDVLEENHKHAAHQQPAPDALPELGELGKILRGFGLSTNSFRKEYAEDLVESLKAFAIRTKQIEQDNLASVPTIEMIREALVRSQIHVKNVLVAIDAALTAKDPRALWLRLGAMKPLSTVTDLLKLLRSTESVKFGSGMKEAIVSYGISLTDVQHLTRVYHALLSVLSGGNQQALHNELRQLGHQSWKPIETPDWLLLEIDSNIIIRDEQVTVAKAMIDPHLGNGVLQLSMGKGKTSCIIPMVAAVLADGRNLSRVIVPKALILQTAQTMQSKLGDLLGRQIVHIPFSRKTQTDKQLLDLYSELHHETQRSHNVVLTCADHLLSFKLCGWQKFIDSNKSIAEQMIGFQAWLNTNSRDVLDECDFTLSVKTQLNYPSGSEMAVDFHPYRWGIVQDLLGLIDCHIRDLQCQQPNGILVTLRRENFPAVQFLRETAENSLHERIIEDICYGRITLLRPADGQYQRKGRAIREVLCGAKLSEKLLSRVAGLFENPDMALNALLLVRGLLMHKIIILCLNKRWNVHYGLHPDRDPIAVPFEAKGKPSEQAEYGHTDVAILFTCLSFYYAGLTQAQLIQVVGHILQSSDPAAEYEGLTSTCPKLPASLRRWTVLNTDDGAQMEQLWTFLRWNRTAINHFLNQFVFPVHARQFEIKLQACSWDIPICSENNTQLTRTSGFSGTNDNRWILPLTIEQRDLPELKHTSAEVLSYLLQLRNREFYMIPDPREGVSKEQSFLRDLRSKNISVLIDVGAYISEMSNQELAHKWLEVDYEAKAVVYYRNDNRAWVHYKTDTKEDVPLLATPFAEDLTGCNVFLDEGHTRGVDLRLPANAVGAVTLALKLTKDHAVQAAMRLRQLQTSQTVCFYGPREVVSSIRDFHRMKLPFEKIDSAHVISWLLEQTCRSIDDQKGLYAAQGIDFCQRTDTIWQCKKFMTNLSERQKLLKILKQPERKTLQELYGPALKKSATSLESGVTSPQLRSFVKKLTVHNKDGPDGTQVGAFEEVEQEREVEAEVEQVRQVEKRKKYDALSFPGMHPDVVQFAHTGILEASSKIQTQQPGFEHAFSFVGRTAIGKNFGVHSSNANLFVSREFTRTVQIAKSSHEGDNFIRPVEWILWAPQTGIALVIIPEEAEHLLAHLRRRQGQSHVHLLTYAAAVTKAMVQFNSLNFYNYPELPTGFHIPERIKIELGILAGRLYVDEHEWKTVADYVKGTATDNSTKIATNPATFVLEWLTIRRKTVNVLRTPMGYICTGREMGSMDLSEHVNGHVNGTEKVELAIR